MLGGRGGGTWSGLSDSHSVILQQLEQGSLKHPAGLTPQLNENSPQQHKTTNSKLTQPRRRERPVKARVYKTYNIQPTYTAHAHPESAYQYHNFKFKRYPLLNFDTIRLGITPGGFFVRRPNTRTLGFVACGTSQRWSKPRVQNLQRALTSTSYRGRNND